MTVGAAIDFASLAVLSRGLGPADFGFYGTFLTLMTLIGGVGDLGLSVIITNHLAHSGSSTGADRDESSLAVILGIKSAISTALVGAGILALVLKGGWHAESAEGRALFLTMLGAAAFSFSTWVTAWLQGTQRFGANALYVVGGSSIKFAAIVALSLSSTLSASTALAAVVLANIAVLLTSAVTVSWPSLRLINWISFRNVWTTFRWVGPWSILGAIIPRVDILIVGSLAGATLTGQYIAATRLCGVFSLLNTVSRTVLLPKLSALSDPSTIHQFLRIWGLLTLAMVGVGLLPLEVMARQLVQIAFGSQYEPSVLLFRILIIGTFLELALNPFAFAALALKRPEAMTISHAVRLSTMVLLGFVFGNTFGATGVAWAVAVSAVIALGGLAVFITTHTAVQLYTPHASSSK